jgi:hypothetical protein
MSNKRKGQETVTGRWAKHLRPVGKRSFWKKERQTARRAERGANAASSKE